MAAKLAKAAQQSGKNADGTAGGRGKKKNLSASCAKVNQDHSKRTTAQAASAVGMSARTYEKAKAVAAKLAKAAQKDGGGDKRSEQARQSGSAICAKRKVLRACEGGGAAGLVTVTS